MPLINSHNSWSQLEEVWLGDVYPAAWYDHLAPEVRDVFQDLTHRTQEDLTTIQHTLESLGVVVRRPVYNNIEDFVDSKTGHLVKPIICPRDYCVVIDNRLFMETNSNLESAWKDTLALYRSQSDCSVVPNISPRNEVNGANVVRMGRDIVIDTYFRDWQYQNQWPEYRVHTVSNGGHLDGCFAIMRPGLLLANNYFDDYDTLFPGWEKITMENPSYWDPKGPRPFPNHNGKFWNTGTVDSRMFNQHVVNHALDWVGLYTETYFELNCLVVNESTVVMLGNNPGIEKALNDRGINVIWVPMRTRAFWDGGMHCLTVDIRRRSTLEDYFPGR